MKKLLALFLFASLAATPALAVDLGNQLNNGQKGAATDTDPDFGHNRRGRGGDDETPVRPVPEPGTMALAAMGLETDIGKLYAKGLRPLAVGAVASVFISVLSLTLIKLTS